MRLLLIKMLVFVSFGIAPTVQAGDYPIVVELYTSQGCSSCPPADALLREISNRDDVVALALHVDYWDYIGWKDTFGSPANTVRQKAYARASRMRTVYTPQLVVGGKDHLIGNEAMKLADLIAAHKAKPSLAGLTISREGARLSVALRAADGKELPRKMVLQLVHFNPRQDVKITRGENRGRTLSYANIVTQWTQIGSWNGRSAKSLSVDLAGYDGPVAVILQTDGHGPVIAAAQLR